MIMRPLFRNMLVLLLLTPYSAFSQSWVQQSSGSSATLHGVHMAGPDSGWSVGNSGEILYTTDGGNVWNSQSPGITAPLYDVDTYDGMTSWIVGGFPQIGTQYGTLGYTTDGGSTWNSPSLSLPYEFTSVSFVDALEGWFVADGGGTIYHSTDGGQNWTSQSTGSGVFKDVFFIDSSTGWIAGHNGSILFSTDGGNSWNTPSTPVTKHLNAVHFADLSYGWAVGNDGTILHSSDGGSSWSTQSSPVSMDLHDVHFIDDTVGWAVGKGGTVLHTTDGGVNWNTENSGTSEDLHAVHFPVDTIGWAVGTNGAIFVRTQSCQTTSSSISPSACYSYTVPSGDTSYSSSGFYTDTLPNANQYNCDSIIDIDLTIDTVDTNVTQISNTELEAQDSGASYQWLDCDSGYAAISGATGQVYQAGSNGSYAVEVSSNGCTDTSSCHSIQNVGIQDGRSLRKVRIIPNPTKGRIRLQFGHVLSSLTVNVMTPRGELLSTYRYEATSRVQIRLEGKPGLYFLELVDKRGRRKMMKLVKH